MKIQTLAAVLMVALLSACTSMEELFNHPPGNLPEARCQAAGAQAYLGRELDEQLVTNALRTSGAMRSRIVRPGYVATTDVDPLRLNIEVDGGGIVRRLSCG